MSPVDRSTLRPRADRRPALSFIERQTLANGLEIRAIAHRAVPVVCAVLIVRGGTAADPPDHPGLAAFMADLLDEGSGGRSALAIADALARFGADFDVDVGSDAIVVSLTTLARFLEPSLALLAEMALSPNLAEPDIERVRKLRLERLQQLRDHAPALADRAFCACSTASIRTDTSASGRKPRSKRCHPTRSADSIAARSFRRRRRW